MPLGIHSSAWQEAVDQMGDFAAALCVLIIDNNVAHPDTPIQSPGGVLRAMTARHQAGQLRLNQSLVAIRKRKGKQVE
ncbi:replication initiation protein RepC [Ruegeria atlantica]|uniref:replication initiation protein RepC n=1 Tax=Ruegeria atlantica TaxID=81569 RepID=UPI0014818562